MYYLLVQFIALIGKDWIDQAIWKTYWLLKKKIGFLIIIVEPYRSKKIILLISLRLYCHYAQTFNYATQMHCVTKRNLMKKKMF